MTCSYRINKELGHNRSGGRVTYLATDTQTNALVVVKQFQFARANNSWVDFDAHQREAQLLQSLDHPGIPRYLNSFQTKNGFCLVQEYKDAIPLSKVSSFNPEEIRQIAIAALQILSYLQNRIPAVIHRDIKPDNMLIDNQGNLYLVDFGFAHVGEGEVGVSSVVKGTLGFMPPEQLFHRQLTEASDLYGLGMTLICLLTGTPTDQIGNLVDISYRVSFKHLVPQLNHHWIHWLEKMVEPRVADRFPNAAAAIAAMPTAPLRPPQALITPALLKFQATKPSEVITQSVTITNPIPDTQLEGRWEVAFHPHDPDPEHYRWITVDPVQFTGNQVTCQVTVDTRPLMTNKTYQRTVYLHTNTLTKTLALDLSVQTMPRSQLDLPIPYLALSVFWAFLVGLSWLVGGITTMLNGATQSTGSATFGTALGLTVGLEAASWMMRSANWRLGATASTAAASSIGCFVLAQTLTGQITGGSSVLIGAVLGFVSGAIVAFALGFLIQELTLRAFSRTSALVFCLLTAVFAVSFGSSLAIAFQSATLSTLLVVTASTLLALILRRYMVSASARFTLRKAERGLIKP